MSFEIDKSFARQHYAKNSLLFIFVSIILFFISFLLIIFYISNTTITIISCMIIILSIITSVFSMVRYFMGNYGVLSIIDNKIVLTKDENVGGYDNTHLYEKNKYIYDILLLKEVVIKTKFIYVYGDINMKKEYGAGKTFAHMHILEKKEKKVSLIKIPRIFANEDKIIYELNNMKREVYEINNQPNYILKFNDTNSKTIKDKNYYIKK